MQPARAGRPTSAARHLGRDMECQQDRRYADEPKKLIHRKHGSPPKVPQPRPPRPASIPPLHHHVLLARQQLVRIGSS